jgi:hypothetical protein
MLAVIWLVLCWPFANHVPSAPKRSPSVKCSNPKHSKRFSGALEILCMAARRSSEEDLWPA